MAYVIFLWLAGESIRDGLEDLQARPWTMPPRPPHISPPCIITPRPVYDWPGEFKSTTKEKGKKNGSTRPNHHTPHRSNPADGRVAGSALIPADPAKPGQKPDAKR
jgi:hypothetical protein